MFFFRQLNNNLIDDVAASTGTPLFKDNFLSEVGLGKNLDLTVVGSQNVQSLLDLLVSLYLGHAAGGRTLPVEPDVTRLILNSLQFNAEGEQSEVDFVVTESVSQRGNTTAGALEHKVASFYFNEDPGTMGGGSVGVLSNSVLDRAHCASCYL